MAALDAGTEAVQVTPASATANFLLPAGTQPGDTVYIWCAAGFGSITWSATGFTAQTGASGTNGSCQLLSYAYLGTEGWAPGTTTITVTMSASHVWAGYIFASAGVADGGLSSGQVNAASTTITVSGVTATVTGDLYVWLGFNTGSAGAGGAPATITVPTGFTAIGTGAKTTGSGATTNTGILMAQTSLQASGASGAQNGGAGASVSNGGLLLALSGDTSASNSFEGVTPAGTTITTGNSGGGSGTPFDLAPIGSGGTLVSASGAAHGLLCASLEDTSAATTAMQWTSNGPFGPQSQVYFRFYAKISANPGATVRLINSTTGGGSLFSVFLNTTGKISATYSSAGTAFVTFTAAVPVGSWFRVEGFFLASATAGQVSASMFTSNPDGLTPDETHTSAATLNVGTLSGTTTYSLGDSSSIAMTSAILFDEWALDNTGPIGPVSARHPKWLEVRFPLTAEDADEEFFGAFVL